MPGKILIPNNKSGLAKFKYEIARELGVPISEADGRVSAKQCGKVGGSMVKKMIEDYEKSL